MIKITKAGIKELIVHHYKVFVPKIVEEEVVADGKKKNCPDAFVVEQNIHNKAVLVVPTEIKFKKGDEALQGIYKKTNYDAVATDDARLIKKLKAQNVPFILPGLLLYKLLTLRLITRTEAQRGLGSLEEYISEDEMTTVQLLMEKIK